MQGSRYYTILHNYNLKWMNCVLRIYTNSEKCKKMDDIYRKIRLVFHFCVFAKWKLLLTLNNYNRTHNYRNDRINLHFKY